MTARLRAAGCHDRRGDSQRGKELLEDGIRAAAAVAEPSAFLRQLRSASIQTLVLIQRDEERTRVESGAGQRDGELDTLLELQHEDVIALAQDFPANERFAASASNSFAMLAERALTWREWERARECALEAARRRRELCERNPADPEHWANLGVALQRAAEAELALERPEQHVDCVLRALEAHRESLARGGSSSNERDILALLRTYATAAHRKRDSEGLDWVAERLQTWLGHQFAPHVDAARCAMLAAAHFDGEDGEERQKRRATAVACLERAFAIDPRQTKIVGDFARDLGLADEPRIVELLAPK